MHQAMPSNSGEPPPGAPDRRPRVWAIVAAGILAVGIVGSAAGAQAVAHDDADRSRRDFEASSAKISSTLELAIQHQEDLIISTVGFILDNPEATNEEFAQWATAVRAFERFPEVPGFGFSVLVPASELEAFKARALRDPAGPLAPDGSFQVIPPGDRPYYCLAKVELERDPQDAIPAGLDFCASNPVNMRVRDTGEVAFVPFEVRGTTILTEVVPIYRGGVTPPTVEARREAFVGWAGMGTIPDLILDRALQGHAGTMVRLAYDRGDTHAVFEAGKAPSGAASVTIDLQEGWELQTFGAVNGGGIFDNGDALALLIAGIALSLLLATLVLVLATGRSRALRLVHERTIELREAQAQLVDAARQAGMAEIATNVLHNVGNVLNSVNVSADLISQKVRRSRSAGLSKAVALLNEHTDDLAGFLTTDARGKALPGYLEALAATLAVEQESIDSDLGRLTKGVAHIKEIVASQQSLAGLAGVTESVKISELVTDALGMAGLDREAVSIVCDLDSDPLLTLDRQRVLLILLNLISNSMHAMKANVERPREIRFRGEVTDDQQLLITVGDSGVGIPAENLARIFTHGFTTHQGGHGFGLHSSAVAAQEMGGTLTVDETAVDGASFTLRVPLEPARDRELVSA